MSNLISEKNLVINKRSTMRTSRNTFMNCQSAKRTFGFTLIEVMVVVAIVGILASVAYPSYVDHVTRSKRAEPLRELTRIANIQEQFFVDNRNYTNDLSQLGLGPNASFETESEDYIITSVVVGNTFILTATAQGIQAARDSKCLTIGITDTGAKISAPYPPTKCWEP